MSQPRDAILSIQSQVAYGHVGNSAAVLPLQRLGFDVFPLNTVQLAHHPGYGAWRGHKLRPEQLDEILRGLEEHGVLGRCAAVLSGYLGDPGVADVVARAVAAVRRARPEALYLCDPVIGDDGPGVFVSAGVPEAIRERLVPLADIVVPNRFELAQLTAAAGRIARGRARRRGRAARPRSRAWSSSPVSACAIGRASWRSSRTRRTRPGWSRPRSCRCRSAAAPATRSRRSFSATI